MRTIVSASLVTFLAAAVIAPLAGCGAHETVRVEAAPPPPPAPPAVVVTTPPPPAPPAAAVVVVAPPAPPAPAAHPAYLHALSDLRNARFNLERKGGDRAMKWDEHTAVDAIDRAINELKLASIDDGKNLADHPPVDAKEPRRGRLHKALDALRAAKKDCNEAEDNAAAAGLKGRAVHHIEEAIRFTEAGIAAADHDT